ncbi:Hypothetical protein A7982_13889 [Minicystis rosea]|nr:Hypothetical protein A7982_13889 [Minicystis rosea]
MVMKRVHGIFLAALAGALSLGGCQLIAGVHTDAVPLGGGGHGGHGGGGHGGACQNNDECASNLCLNGFCCGPTSTKEQLCAGHCGQMMDECGHLVDCPGCTVPETCGGAGEANVCACGPGCPIWAKTFGTSTSGMKGIGLALDSEEHIILTGDAFGSINFGGGALPLVGDGDAFYAKLDVEATQLSARSFGVSTRSQFGAAAAAGGAGHAILAGAYRGGIDFGGATLTGVSGYDIFVVELDASGKHVWSKSFGGQGDQEVTGVAVDASGNTIVVGSFADSLDFGSGELTYVGGKDIFVAKLDPSGAHLWSKSFGGQGDQEVTGVAVDAAGEVMIVGHHSNGLDFGGTVGAIPNEGGKDAFVAKLDASGEPVWAKALGDASEQRGFGIASDASGNILVTGGFQGTIDFGGGTVKSPANDGVFLAKLDASGNHVWSKVFGGDETTIAHGRSVAFTGSGDVVVSGDVNGVLDFGGGPRPGYGGLFVARLNGQGDHVWSRGFGGGGLIVQGTEVLTDVSGNIIVAGSYNGSVDFGFGLVTANNSNANIFLMKLSAF